MTTETHKRAPEAAEMLHYPVVENMISLFADWLQRRRDMVELWDCGAAGRTQLAEDVGLSTGELGSLVRRGGHAADELPKLLDALNLDPEALKRKQPEAMRDMQRVCSHCRDKRRCNYHLRAGTAAHDHLDYCSNAATLAALMQSRI